jgi:pantetheine-phosphate adenylyltransferase
MSSKVVKNMKNKQLIAVFPGTFDPITNGHLDILERALHISDRLILAVAKSPKKGPLFSLEERLDLVKRVVQNIANVEVQAFDGLTVEFARQAGATVLIRGLRAISDFEYEFQMALANRKLAPEVDTVFLMPSQEYSYLNSTLVREIAGAQGDVSALVPALVAEGLKSKFAK